MLYHDLWTKNNGSSLFFRKVTVSDLLFNGPWPLAVEEHLAIKYSFDQIKIGEFVRFCAGLPTNENLEVRIFKKFSLDVPNNLSLWQD